MEGKMIPNSVPLRPIIPNILINATVKVLQDDLRSEERSFKRGQEVGESASDILGCFSRAKRAENEKNKENVNTRTDRCISVDERWMVGEQCRRSLVCSKGLLDNLVVPSAPPLDYSFSMLSKVEEIVRENRRPQTKRNLHFPQKICEQQRYKTSSLRLSYNSIVALQGLANVLHKILDGGPFGLCWLDLSFNAITRLDDATFSQLPNLKILYLHGNAIADMMEIRTLQQLKRLASLTLHGNPLEEESAYRISVLYYLPWLKHLDFVSVSKTDKSNAKEFGGRHIPFWKQRHDHLEAIHVSKMSKEGVNTKQSSVM